VSELPGNLSASLAGPNTRKEAAPWLSDCSVASSRNARKGEHNRSGASTASSCFNKASRGHASRSWTRERVEEFQNEVQSSLNPDLSFQPTPWLPMSARGAPDQDRSAICTPGREPHRVRIETSAAVDAARNGHLVLPSGRAVQTIAARQSRTWTKDQISNLRSNFYFQVGADSATVKALSAESSAWAQLPHKVGGGPGAAGRRSTACRLV